MVGGRWERARRAAIVIPALWAIFFSAWTPPAANASTATAVPPPRTVAPTAVLSARTVPGSWAMGAVVSARSLPSRAIFSATSARDGDDLIKVYVVRTAERNGGRPDSLTAIAARTLGDVNRAGEIFQLNAGRPQSDGSSLRDPRELRPGWILRLPADANGPDVQLARETGTGSGQGNGAGQGNDSGQGNGSGQGNDSGQGTGSGQGDGAGQGNGSGQGDGSGQGNGSGQGDDAGQGNGFSQGNGAGQGGSSAQGDESAPVGGSPAANAVVLPLPIVLSVLGALLLGLLTAAIVARRRLRRAFAWVPRLIRRLGEPARRARRLAYRRSLAQAFAGDAEAPRRAYAALSELTGPEGYSVHAMSVDDAGVTAWVATRDEPPAPWRDLGGARWRRPADAPTPAARRAHPAPGTPTPLLVRVGVDDQGGKVFVDLSRLDGVLSVTGDRAVAGDVVRGLLAEVARTAPATPVAVLPRPGAEAVAVPAGLPRVEAPRPGSAPVLAGARGTGTLRAAAQRRLLRALLVVPGPPTGEEAADLAAFCDPATGWTALVSGDADGAHWRWQALPDGSVEIPVLNLTVSAPA
ncbi:hypothetical protein ABZT47_35070 [Sphaerisporangium sp. NPDC005289]|uniref:hypothetical protein n=1 Tax=Sphaerisporangium sp. NPDC005289 TaxID=3155247 RepID=UPI0033B41818